MEIELSSLYGQEIYTDRGVYVGRIEDVNVDITEKRVSGLAVRDINPNAFDAGDLKGFITITTVKKVPVEQRHLLSVSDVMRPYDSIGRLISNEDESAEALKMMIRDKLEFIAVKDDTSGDFAGIITRKDLATYIEMLSGRF
ncbi:Sporulation protein YlmC, PRC-barrel domain family [Candidatus Methanophagaceae archaeon]|nr:Sporulation protein YlmC, PRC-barrel domain family [Methanophagales archaeon]